MTKAIPEAAFEIVQATDREPQQMYLLLNGNRIAKRGQPDSPQAKTWIALEPGYRVFDRGRRGVTVEFHGERVH